MIYEDKTKKLETLPWQVLFDIAIAKNIEEAEIKGKDKSSIIEKLLIEKALDNTEIESLVNDYIYGDRVV